MRMNRRGFLQTIIATATAPAIVRADSLMRVIPQETTLYVPETGPIILVPGRMVASTTRPGGRWPSMAETLSMQPLLERGIRRNHGRIRDLRYIHERMVGPLADDERKVRVIALFNEEVRVGSDE